MSPGPAGAVVVRPDDEWYWGDVRGHFSELATIVPEVFVVGVGDRPPDGDEFVRVPDGRDVA